MGALDVVAVADVGGGAGDLWIQAGSEVMLLSGETRGEADLSDPLARLASPSCEGCSYRSIASLPDADADGVAELAVEGWDRAWIVPGATRGVHGTEIARAEIRFEQPSASIAVGDVGDLDGDGVRDAVVSVLGGQMGTWALPDDLSGTFVVAGTPDTALSGKIVALGDLDGDGHDDFALGNGDGEQLLFGDAGGVPSAAGGGTPGGAVAVGDIDGDGLADIVAIRGTEAIVVSGPAYGSASGDAARVSAGNWPGYYGFSLPWAGAGLGDIDGDGSPELAVTSRGYWDFGGAPRDTVYSGPGELWILPLGDLR